MYELKLNIDDNSSTLKYHQLVEAIADAVSQNQLKQGEMLPSVNQVMKETQLSRDTVFKAYAELKKRGIVESVPNRGYFVKQKISKVFLFLDTFKAYKEVLYHAFLNSLPKDVSVDLHFHHYNIALFEKIIDESLGKYSKYIIMNFDNPKVAKINAKIPKEQLLVIDWKINAVKDSSVVYQDFGNAVYKCLYDNIEHIRKYKKFIFYYPSFTYHPKDAVVNFEKFCIDYDINYSVVFKDDEFNVKSGCLYFLVSDRTLASYLNQCEEKAYKIGLDTGVISYNETPMKKYVKNGITVISTDFNLMGQKAASFVKSDQSMIFEVPTELKIRNSI